MILCSLSLNEVHKKPSGPCWSPARPRNWPRKGSREILLGMEGLPDPPRKSDGHPNAQIDGGGFWGIKFMERHGDRRGFVAFRTWGIRIYGTFN